MKKLMVAAAVCALGVGVLEVRATDYTSNTTIDSVEDIPADYTFNVSEGVTVDLNVSIADGDEAVKVTKLGEGKLNLNCASTFTGGFDVQAGVINVNAAGAIGSGDVSILANASTGGNLEFNAPGAIFNNNFTITGGTKTSDSSFAIEASVDTVFTGTVTASGYTKIGANPIAGTSASGDDKNHHCISWNGPISAASSKTTLYVRTYGTNVFNGAVSARSMVLGSASSARGRIVFANPKNAITAISNSYQPILICADTNVLGDASWSIGLSNGHGAMYHWLYMNGHDQRMNYLAGGLATGSATEGTEAITSDDPCTFTLLGKDGEEHESGHRLCGKVSLVLDAENEAFVQTFTDVKTGVTTTHETEGTLRVKRGTLKIAGASTSFPNVPEIIVDETGRFVIASSGQTIFSSVTNLQVAGKLEIDESASVPFAAGVTDLTVGENAEIYIGGSYESVFREVFLPDGTKLPMATYEYPCEAFPQLRQGKIQVVGSGIVDSATWTGNGTDDEVTTVANWDVDEPDFSSGLMSATFASGGSQATVSSAVKFKDVSLSAAEGEAGFTFAKGSDAGKIVLKGSSLGLANASAPCQYAFEVPIELEGSQTLKMTVPVNNALRIDDGVIANDGSLEFAAGEGSDNVGTIFWGGDSVVAGVVKSAIGFNLRVSGRVSAPGHVDQGAAKSGGEQTFTCLQYGSSSASNQGLILTNAVIEKPLFIAGGASAVARIGLWSLKDTTNAITGNLLFGGTMGGNGLHVYTDGELTLSGGMSATVPMRMRTDGTGRVLVRNRPLDVVRTYDYSDGDTLFLGLSLMYGTLDIDAPSNRVNYLNVGYDSSNTNPKRTVEFRRDDMFSEYPATLTAGFRAEAKNLVPATASKIDARVEFHSTTQRFARVLAGPRATFNGEGGSRLEVVGEQAAGDYVPESSVIVAAPFTGGLSLLMGGTGSLVLTNAASTSTGSLAVTNGELRVAAGASWTNVSSVAVGGTGRLTIDAVEGEDRAKVFGKGAVLELSEDGVIAVPDGVRIRFLSLTMDGAPMAPGVYSYATAPDAVKRHLADTTGEIMIGRPGLILIFR